MHLGIVLRLVLRLCSLFRTILPRQAPKNPDEVPARDGTRSTYSVIQFEGKGNATGFSRIPSVVVAKAPAATPISAS